MDGEIRELDDRFSNGLKFPGDPDGDAGEVINCRCALLQRARWAINENGEEEDFTKMNNETGEIMHFDNTKDYNDFKKQYWKEAERIAEKAEAENGGSVGTAVKIAGADAAGVLTNTVNNGTMLNRTYTTFNDGSEVNDFFYYNR